MPIWHGAFYTMLALATVLALTDKARGHPVLIVGFSALLGAWHWAMIIRHPDWAHKQLSPLLIYFGVGAALLAALVVLHSAYMFLAGVFYALLFTLLPIRLAVAGALALTVGLVWRQIDVSQPLSELVGPLLLTIVATALGILLALFIDAIIRQSDERRRLIDELQAARHSLAAAERQAGVLEERQRLAHDIHDTLAQSFTSIVMHLEALEQVLPAGAETAQRHLDQARRTARGSLAETRQLVWALRPESLERGTLNVALNQLAERWSDETSIPAEAVVTGTPHPLIPQIEITLLRAAQEALANIRKHACAGQVIITLSYMGDSVALDVYDDGKGFDPARCEMDGRHMSGFGLIAMRERVGLLGGTLQIESAPGEGTMLTIGLPLLEEERSYGAN
jgi:signal transduction histidine kinase